MKAIARKRKVSLKIFRAVRAGADTTSKLHEYKKTMRPPGNVPYVVDNLWEWKRPEGFPCRRFSVYASPTAELAKESGRKDSEVFLVEFTGRFRLAQVAGYEDSKKHPDCRNLRDRIQKILGQAWIDASMAEKEKAGRLWMPCLRKEEVELLFAEVEVLKRSRDEIFNAITYWDDVVLVNKGEGLPDSIGELFFEAYDGHYLRPVGNTD